MEFIVLERGTSLWGRSPNTIRLISSTWNDFAFRTLFNMEYIDNDNVGHNIGQIKIGFTGQLEKNTSVRELPHRFSELESKFFSIAESPEFYKELYAFGTDFGDEVLKKLNCILVSQDAYNIARLENVFTISLIRNVHFNTLYDQFERVRRGDSILTDYNFRFVRQGKKFSDLYLTFEVSPESLPPTNIHTIIGRNGLGKTTLLNEMIGSIMSGFMFPGGHFQNSFGKRIGNDFFSAIISIAFSAFDPFQWKWLHGISTEGTCYSYIGLKGGGNNESGNRNTDYMEVLYGKCADSVYECCSDVFKKQLWLESIKDLESDENFKDLRLGELADCPPKQLKAECKNQLHRMSSGHAIVFITISMLIDKLQEKTLVLFDEPESHLHPPLLSALVRVMSNLLHRRNGVAIIATHSPVVVQEVPKSCCWVLTRFGDITKFSRPKIETFAENVGTLTKEVFRLEMEESGYHKLLKRKVDDGLSFEDIIRDFGGKIGFEGRAVLMSMVMLRDSSESPFIGDEDE